MSTELSWGTLPVYGRPHKVNYRIETRARKDDHEGPERIDARLNAIVQLEHFAEDWLPSLPPPEDQ
jgi:hypothetical protein